LKKISFKISFKIIYKKLFFALNSILKSLLLSVSTAHAVASDQSVGLDKDAFIGVFHQVQVPTDAPDIVVDAAHAQTHLLEHSAQGAVDGHQDEQIGGEVPLRAIMNALEKIIKNFFLKSSRVQAMQRIDWFHGWQFGGLNLIPSLASAV